MITIKPAQDNPMVLTFDGTVLEVFKMDSSDRIHISLLSGLEIKTDKKGKHTLDINGFAGYAIQGHPVDNAALSKINRLIAEIQMAKGAFQFD